MGDAISERTAQARRYFADRLRMLAAASEVAQFLVALRMLRILRDRFDGAGVRYQL